MVLSGKCRWVPAFSACSWHLMGSAGCGVAWLKPQSADLVGGMLQNRRHHLLPPSGVAPARELVTASCLAFA